jgi:hypothetical protein
VVVGPEVVGGMPLQHCFSVIVVAIVVVDDFSACIDVVAVAVAVVDDGDALAPSGGVVFLYNYDHDKEKVSTTMMGDCPLQRHAETNAELNAEPAELLLLRLAEQILSLIWLFWTYLTLDFQQNLLAFVEVFGLH